MMEHGSAIKNPLLETYGSVVTGFFAPGKAVGDPVAIFPGLERESQADTLPYKPDLEFFQPGAAEIKKIQQTVDQLREALRRENQMASSLGDRTKRRAKMADRVRAVKGQAEGIQQVHFHMDAFQKAIASGDESLLAGNPFYDLAKLIFRLNCSGAVVLWNHLQTELASNAPEPVRLSRPLRDIWKRSKKRRSPLNRLFETVGLLFYKTKPLLETVLILVSGFTTWLAVDGLLQTPEASRFLLALIDGRQEGTLRFLLSLTAAFFVGTTVLDFKRRLFLASAESGRVLKGLRTAFLVDPRWMLVAGFVVFFSVKTNYDAIVSVVSKGAYLTEQSTRVGNTVNGVLGGPGTVNADNPVTLYDLRAWLKKRTGATVAFFEDIPPGELQGRDPRKGPRYWSKHYIVLGGYQPGKRDVAHSFRNVGYARRKDDALKRSGLDLSTSLAQKIQKIVDKYNEDFDATVERVQKRMAELDGLMRVESLTLANLPALLTAAPREFNGPLDEIVQAVVANKRLFDESLAELNRLFPPYLQLLREIDPKLDGQFRAAEEKWRFATFGLPAIESLRTTHIPPATDLSFEQLKKGLVAEHGSGRGKVLLMVLLLASFAIDFLTVLLYIRKTARQGAADRLVSQEIVKYLREWENAFVDLYKSFFYRPAVQQVFRGMTFPNETGVRNAYYKLLEEVEPRVKDAADMTSGERFKQWWGELFRPTRTLYITGYNTRALTIDKLLTKKNTYFPRIFERLLPGLQLGKFPKSASFLDLYQNTEEGQSRDKREFSLELKRVAMANDPTLVFDEPEEDGRPVSRISRFFGTVSTRVKSIGRIVPRGKGRHPDRWTSMVKAAAGTVDKKVEKENEEAEPAGEGGLVVTLRELLFERAFHGPFPRFTHTRRSWLLEMSSVDEQSLEDLDTLHDFIPDFVKMLKKVLTNTLPVIQESLDPLESICARFPESCSERGISDTGVLNQKLQELEKESLGMWGACVSHLLGDEGGSGVQLNKPDISSLTDILADGGDISHFYDRIHALMNDAEEAVAAAREIENTAVDTIKTGLDEIKTGCDEVNRMLVKINFLGLELRKLRPLPHAKLRTMNENSALLVGAPKVAEALLAERERVLKQEELFNDVNFKTVAHLKNKAGILYSRVRKVMDAVDK